MPGLHSGDKSYVYTGDEPPSTDENVKQYVGASTSLGPSSPKHVNELDQMISRYLVFISECCFIMTVRCPILHG